jgi:iron complex outermembrane receptor protein
MCLRIVTLLIFATFPDFLAAPALAQPQTGTISGTVRDATGAVVPGATVTITSQETGAARVVRSSSDGTFTVADLPAGPHTISAEFPGFGTTTVRDVRVTAAATAVANLTLETGRLEDVITVTGTRVAARTAIETAAPVDILDSQTLQSTGASETGKILQLVAPSVNFSTTFISDGTDMVRPATLRALGPDQTLLLVNGKRRHQTALIHVQQTVARGTAGYDVNTIPASAIERVEVLRDGAAAQYGSDAIAGVINFILKRRTGTEITFEAGQHYDENPELPLGASPDARGGHGPLFLGAINTGWGFGRGAFVNFTAEYRDRGETNRAVADTLRVNPPRVIQRIGDAKASDVATFVNAEFPVGTRGGAVYAFGGYSYRKGNSSGFFRSKEDGRTVPDFYPNGFLPTIVTRPIDASGAGGYRRVFANNQWRYDASANFGLSEFSFREENTVNVSYFYEPINRNNPIGARFRDSPRAADTGTLQYDQVGLNLDFTGTVDWRRASGPLNVATGAEWRREGYMIEPGEEVSYEYGRNNDRSISILNQNGGISLPGTQGFPGFDPSTAVDENRNNSAVYLDVESQVTRQLLAAGAVRYEHYSDFGGTFTGKASGRFNFTDQFAVRGTASTGFRAPGVQQKFFSLRSTNLNAAGVLTDTLTARQDSAVTRDFGISPLKEETSRNYSGGIVVTPTDTFRVTVDLYRIDIDDRIVFSSNVQPEAPTACGVPFSPTRCPITVILDRYVPGGGQVQFFTNAIDTRTKGFDIVALYDWALRRNSTLLLEGSLHFNDTNVRARKSSSAILPPEVLFDQAQVTLVEEGQPGEHFVLSGTYLRGFWRANVRANYFGKVAGEGFTPGFKQVWGGKWLTDVLVTVPLQRDRLSLTIGALNVFNVYPDEWDPVRAFPFPQLGFRYGWETMPFGINGGHYFARLNVRLAR